MNDTIIDRTCEWEGCHNRAGKGKYCPSCAKIARAKWVEMIKAKEEERTLRDAKFAALYDIAHAAGMAALVACQPRPMVVQEHANMADDTSPVAQQWIVEGGACGFAWVTVMPATCSFAHWLKKHKGCSKAYYGGMQIWVHEGGQSMARKEAYANAFAEVLKAAGIKAYSGSRMD
jgi:hypothetical protein